MHSHRYKKNPQRVLRSRIGNKNDKMGFKKKDVRRICYHYLNGKCRRKNCNFDHVDLTTEEVLEMGKSFRLKFCMIKGSKIKEIGIKNDLKYFRGKYSSVKKYLPMKGIEKINIFDFDSTLFVAPNEERYLKTQKKKKFKDDEKYYLSKYYFNGLRKGERYQDYERCQQNKKENELNVLLTGRFFKNALNVRNTCWKNDAYFDLMIFKHDDWFYSLGTKWNKIWMLNVFFKEKFPDLKEIDMYEDRIDHLREFERHSKSLNFNLNLLFASQFQIELIYSQEDNNFSDVKFIFNK